MKLQPISTPIADAPPQKRVLLDMVNLIADNLETRGARISEVTVNQVVSVLSNGEIAAIGILYSGRRYVLMISRERGA